MTDFITSRGLMAAGVLLMAGCASIPADETMADACRLYGRTLEHVAREVPDMDRRELERYALVERRATAACLSGDPSSMAEVTSATRELQRMAEEDVQ